MATKLTTPTQYTTSSPAPAVRVTLLQPRAFVGKNGKPQGEPKYGLQLLLDPAGHDAISISKMVKAIAAEAFPGVAPAKLRWPVQAGDKMNQKRAARGKDAFAPAAGRLILTARSAVQPRLSANINNSVVDLADAEQIKLHGRLFYNGARMLVQVNFAPYGEGADADGGENPPGITAYLNHVYSTGLGDRIGGGGPATEVFKGYLGATTAYDPMTDTTGDDAQASEDTPF